MASTVSDWPRAATGARRVLKPGGKLSLNVWDQEATVLDEIVEAFRSAGFADVERLGKNAGTMITATR